MARKIKFVSRRAKSRHNQKGIVLIIFAFLLGLAVTGLGIKFLSGGSFQIQQSVKSTQALAEAKAAVIGNVISGQSGVSAGIFPCSEDTLSIGSPNEGQAGSSCNTTSIGRFAWRTMDAGDLVDGSNDKLWYALSAGFRAVPVNSDTIGQLSVDGVQNQAIAILFSPGAMLSSQSRPTPTSSSAPQVANYLEMENSDGDADFITGALSASFNDKLVLIKSDDIFPILEKRVLGEIKKYLLAYKVVWGAFPFPATFSMPSTASYVGVSGNSGGLLPVAGAGVTWLSGTATSVRASNGAVKNGSCVVSSSSQVLTCTISSQSYSGARTVTIDANLNNIGLGFYKQMDVTKALDFTITPTALKTALSLKYSLNNSGGGKVTLQGRPTSSSGTYKVVFNRPPQLDDWNTTTALPNYIYKNNWHHLIYYKIAAPFLPGGNGVCGTSCLSVNAINTPNTILTGQHALLMTAGRKLDATNVRSSPTYGTSNPAQIRPGFALADYFDSSNNISGGLIFDSINRPLATFNDQVQIVE